MARTTTEHTVTIQSAKPSGVTRLEAVGTSPIIPGHLLEFESNGYVKRHATASGAAAPFVAMELFTPDTHTYPTTAAIDIPYADGDSVYFAQGQPGDVFNMWIASGQDVTKGLDWMISDGSGRLKSCGTGVSVGTSNPIGIAWESAAASGTAVRCQVRIV